MSEDTGRGGTCSCPLVGECGPASRDLCQSAQEASGIWDRDTTGCPCPCHLEIHQTLQEGPGRWGI